MQSFGLLIIRVGFGISFIIHGWPKLSGGSEVWEHLGAAMGNFGIHIFPVFWGLMAAISEFFGGILLLVGLFTRYAAFAMFCVMVVACMMHIQNGDIFTIYSHALKAGVVFLAMIFLGGGQYALDSKIKIK